MEDDITRVIEELGLARSLAIPGASSLEYIVEEVWVDGQDECRLK